MIAILILLLAQSVPCTGEAARSVAMGDRRAEAFDPAGASDAYLTAASLGCADAEIGAHYLRGLLAAREAYRFGGSPESLEPVKQAVAALEARGAKTPGIAEVARFVLLAASAAAQSERDEMTLLIEHAMHLEVLQLAAGERGTPGATAHEVAGDLFLLVHRYEDARSYYNRAAERVGTTPRLRLGLARAAARLKDTRTACDQYQALLAWWDSRSEQPEEIAEARAFVRAPACQAPPRR